MTAFGKTEYVAGWCFQGWVSVEELAKVLLELRIFLDDVLVTDPWIQKFPVKGKFFTRLIRKPDAKILMMLKRSSIVGTTHRYRNDNKQEEHVHVLLSSYNKFSYYETGAFLAKQLGMPMLRKGYFDY